MLFQFMSSSKPGPEIFITIIILAMNRNIAYQIRLLPQKEIPQALLLALDCFPTAERKTSPKKDRKRSKLSSMTRHG